MAKPKNLIESVVVQVTTTPQVRTLLERLVATGLYGKNIAEAAERLLARELERRVGSGSLEVPADDDRGPQGRGRGTK